MSDSHATVNRKDLPGDVAAFLGSEEIHHGGDVVDRAKTAQGDDPEDLLFDLLRKFPGHVGGDEARGDRIGGDAPAGQLAGAEKTGSAAQRQKSWRDVGLGAQILRDLNVSSIRLVSSSNRHYVGLSGFGIEIAETIKLD